MRAEAKVSRAKQIKDVLTWMHRGKRTSLEIEPTQVFIFCYHRINTNERNPLGVDLAVFEKQLELFRSEYRLIAPEDFFAHLRGETSLRGSNVLITFDDGYVSTVQAAYPALKAAGARAISFIATAHFGKLSPYSVDKHQESRERVVTLEEVKQSQDVFLYQSHGHEHLDYHHGSKESVLRDLDNSLQTFETQLGYRPTTIAYPFGLAPAWKGWRQDFKMRGIEFGFITGSHSWKESEKVQKDLLNLPRVGYLTDETLEHTRARLTGGLTILKWMDQPWIRRVKSWRTS